MIVMVEQAPPATSHRSRTRLVVQGLLSLVLVVAIFYFLRKKFDPAEAWAAITAMTVSELVILGLLAAGRLPAPGRGPDGYRHDELARGGVRGGGHLRPAAGRPRPRP
jgi:hypothetical protein